MKRLLLDSDSGNFLQSKKARKKQKIQAQKKEVISILKSAHFEGSGAKSWPWAFETLPWSIPIQFQEMGAKVPFR